MSAAVPTMSYIGQQMEKYYAIDTFYLGMQYREEEWHV